MIIAVSYTKVIEDFIILNYEKYIKSIIDIFRRINGQM